MWRMIAGGLAVLLLLAGGLFWWKSLSEARDRIPTPPPATVSTGDEGDVLADPPQASEKTREEKRFSRYDKDKDGRVAREEYLAARRKAFAKLDINGDGRLSFEEYAVKTIDKFGAADADRSGALDAKEFATTRVVRKTPAKPKCICPPAGKADDEE